MSISVKHSIELPLAMWHVQFSDVGQVSQRLEPPATDLPKVILAVAQQDNYGNNIPSLKACISFSALEGINRS